MVIAAVLTFGFVLELFGQRAAAYVNIGLYACYLVWWSSAVISVLRGKAEPEAAGYVIAFAGSAVVILLINVFFYAGEWRQVKTHE